MQEIIELTKELIRFKTMHKNPEEIVRCAGFIENYFKDHNIVCRRVEHAGIPSIIVLPAGGTVPALLMSHIDVVDAPAELFEPVIAPRPAATTSAPPWSKSEDHHATPPQDHGPAAVQLHNSYLIEEAPDGIRIIDQHALHERVLYDQISKRLAGSGLESQRLLIPLTVELAGEPPVKYVDLDEKKILEIMERHVLGGEPVLDRPGYHGGLD